MPSKLQSFILMVFRSFILAAVFVLALGYLATGGAFVNHLLSGETLKTGENLADGIHSLKMQSDCNLVLYQQNPEKTIWRTFTNGKGSQCELKMEKNGNLIIRNERLVTVWESGTGKIDGNYVLLLQRDRNLVIYSTPIWSANTRITT